MAEPLTCVSDRRALARRRVPRALFEYADRGAFEELTLLENRAALDALRLKQRIMMDVDNRSLSTTLAGQPASLPVAIAPTALTGLVAGRVEILFDGGVTSGQAVLKALALGARGCQIGKAFLYGLGALGEEGVSLALEFIRRELDVSMVLTGQRDVQSVPRSIIVESGCGRAAAEHVRCA